jgi:hypothetical protein
MSGCCSVIYIFFSFGNLMVPTIKINLMVVFIPDIDHSFWCSYPEIMIFGSRNDCILRVLVIIRTFGQLNDVGMVKSLYFWVIGQPTCFVFGYSYREIKAHPHYTALTGGRTLHMLGRNARIYATKIEIADISWNERSNFNKTAKKYEMTIFQN